MSRGRSLSEAGHIFQPGPYLELWLWVTVMVEYAMNSFEAVNINSASLPKRNMQFPKVAQFECLSSYNHSIGPILFPVFSPYAVVFLYLKYKLSDHAFQMLSSFL